MTLFQGGKIPRSTGQQLTKNDMNDLARYIANKNTTCTFFTGSISGQFQIKPAIPHNKVDQITLYITPATTEYMVPPNTKLLLSGRQIGSVEVDASISAFSELGRTAYKIADEVVKNNKVACQAIRGLFQNLRVSPFTFEGIHQGGFVETISIKGNKNELYSALSEFKIILPEEATLKGRIYLERLNAKDKDGNKLYRLKCTVFTPNGTPISMSELSLNEQFANALVTQLTKLKSSPESNDLSKAKISR